MKKHGSKSHSHRRRDQTNQNEKRTAGTIEIEIFVRLWKIYVDNMKVVLFLKVQILKPHPAISMIEVDFQVFEEETSIPPTRHIF